MMMCLLRVLSSEKNTDENDVKKGGVFEKFLSLSLPLLSLCLSLFELSSVLDFLKFFILRCIAKNSTFQHKHTTREKRKEERPFSHPPLHTHLVHAPEDT